MDMQFFSGDRVKVKGVAKDFKRISHYGKILYPVAGAPTYYVVELAGSKAIVANESMIELLDKF